MQLRFNLNGLLSKSDNNNVAFLLRPTVPTKVWTGAYTPTLIFLEVGSI
jgi:hypothetical protein